MPTLHAVAEELLSLTLLLFLLESHVERGKLIRVAQPWKLRSRGDS